MNLGLRFETTYGWQPAACQVDTIFVTGQCFPAIEGAPDFKSLVPRASAVYDLFDDGRTALKFSASRYDQPITLQNDAAAEPARRDQRHAHVDRVRSRPDLGLRSQWRSRAATPRTRPVERIHLRPEQSATVPISSGHRRPSSASSFSDSFPGTLSVPLATRTASRATTSVRGTSPCRWIPTFR